MRKFIIILSIITSFSCRAQSPIVDIDDDAYSENIYYKDINGIFNPFIGIWEWEDGNNSITIEIVKLEQEYYEVHNRKLYKDRLIGRIKYIENGQEIFNTLDEIDYTLINNSGAPTANWLGFRFEDPILTRKTGHIDFELINGGTQAKFRLRNTEGARLYQPGQQPEDPNFSMPRRVEFIMNKE